MAVRVGSAIFEDHISIEIIPGKWTDTFIFPIRYDRGLHPWAYAGVVKTLLPTLKRYRVSPSLWVPVSSPGKWYFEEVKFALRNASIPIAVTWGRQQPQILDFSKRPGIYNAPCRGGEPAELSPVFDLSEKALRSLLVLARLTSAYTNEIACANIFGEKACRRALRELVEHGYAEYHPNDGNIDAHLANVRPRVRKDSTQGRRWNGDYIPYWKITRSGVSAALRAWGVPAGETFNYRRERTRLLNSIHRRRSRQWPQWVSQGLPHAEIYAGWNELSILGVRARPDAMAWGKIQGVETLFWLEVESGHSSSTVIEEQTGVRWLKAKGYAEVVGLHLVFVLVGMPWVQRVARRAFPDVPRTGAVILAGWRRRNVGILPFPKWGELVAESS